MSSKAISEADALNNIPSVKSKLVRGLAFGNFQSYVKEAYPVALYHYGLASNVMMKGYSTSRTKSRELKRKTTYHI